MKPVPPIHERTLLHVVRRGAEAHPDAPAISDENISLSYRQLWDRACTIAGGLRNAGVQAGERVLMMLDNSADCFVLLLATSFAGAELVPVNLAWRDAHLAHAIAEASCVAAVVDPEYLPAVLAVSAGRLRTIVVRGGDDSLAADWTWDGLLAGDPVEPVEAGPETTPVIIFTSGTTGRSKGVRTTHAQIFTMCYYSPHLPELGTAEKWYVPAPMFHALGLFGGAFAPLIFGASSFVTSRFSPSRFWAEVRSSGATTMIAVGTMIDFLVAQPERPDDRDNPLRIANCVPRPATAQQFRDRFDVLVTTSYGSSEHGTSIVDWSRNPVDRSLGKPREGVSVRLVDPAGKDVGPNEAGELWLRPEHRSVFTPGYVNSPEATAALERNGWFPTGDVLRRDEAGLLYYVDRLRDSIRRRGENISSVEVELAVTAHDEVIECAAVGVGDPADQEVMVAVIRTPDSTLTESELVLFAAGRLPYYAVPRFVVFVSDLPRTPTGKIQKVRLREADLPSWDREAAGVTIARPGRR